MAVQQLMRLAIANDDFDLVYVLLMSEPIPRCITYDLAWPRFDLDTLTDNQCWVNLRFVKNDVRRLAALVDLPAVTHVSNTGTRNAILAEPATTAVHDNVGIDVPIIYRLHM